MSAGMPEKPILLYPSKVQILGFDGAALLALGYDLLAHTQPDAHGQRSVTLSTDQWQQLTAALWRPEQLTALAARLHAQGELSIHPDGLGHVTIALMPSPSAPAEPPQETTRLPVLEAANLPRRPLPVRNPMRERGPAPAFGGSIGWARKGEGSKDELQRLFEHHEARNQQLHPMQLGWQPSASFYSMLPRTQIPTEFAATCLDEFILYYIDKSYKESNWDQKFLAWVKREWVRQQTRTARQHSNDKPSYTGTSDENSRADTREQRKRVTAAIMDIQDTDW